MYYSAGTYESFAHPEKPKGVDKKSAYVIGTGLAGLTAAFYLVRDGQMKGENIHVFEKLELAGGSCDGYKDVTKGFYMRGGREMDNHFEVMWDTFRDVPSIETPSVSVLDEYYWLNKHDPNYSLCRATVNRGQDAHTDKQFKLDKESAMALSIHDTGKGSGRQEDFRCSARQLLGNKLLALLANNVRIPALVKRP